MCIFTCAPLRVDYHGGYPTFVISIGMIGFCTAIIGDVAGHLGCFIYLKDTVNAIAFVALGTSIPGIMDEWSQSMLVAMVVIVCLVKLSCIQM